MGRSVDERRLFLYEVLYDFLVTVKTAPHECVIRR